MRSKISGVISLILSSVMIASGCALIYAEDADFDYDQNLMKANEFYLAGKRYIQVGNFKAANEAFKKSQQYLQDKSRLSELYNNLQIPANESSLVPDLTASLRDEAKEPISVDTQSAIQQADICYNRGIEFINKKAYALAQQALQEAVRLNPYDKDAHYNLGILYEKLFGNKDKALIHYEKYIEFEPDVEKVKEVKRWIEELKNASIAK